MTPRLSILCPSLLCRVQDSTILSQLKAQIEGKPVELIVLVDNAQASVGEKHNRLLSMARGEYVCFVADDDRVSEDYVESILVTIIDGPDVVTFDVDWQGGEQFLDWQPSSCEGRPLAAVRRTLAQRFKFPDWWQSEDRAFRVWLSRQAASVRHIPRVLYHYVFKAAKPEYGGKMYPPQSQGMATAEQVMEWVRLGEGAPSTYAVPTVFPGEAA